MNADLKELERRRAEWEQALNGSANRLSQIQIALAAAEAEGDDDLAEDLEGQIERLKGLVASNGQRVEELEKQIERAGGRRHQPLAAEPAQAPPPQPKQSAIQVLESTVFAIDDRTIMVTLPDGRTGHVQRWFELNDGIMTPVKVGDKLKVVMLREGAAPVPCSAKRVLLFEEPSKAKVAKLTGKKKGRLLEGLLGGPASPKLLVYMEPVDSVRSASTQDVYVRTISGALAHQMMLTGEVLVELRGPVNPATTSGRKRPTAEQRKQFEERKGTKQQKSDESKEGKPPKEEKSGKGKDKDKPGKGDNQGSKPGKNKPGKGDNQGSKPGKNKAGGRK